MKKRAISLLVTVILVLGLAVPALAYDLPDNSLLEASSASTGTATVTDWNGESHTVYRYPAGTVFTPKSGMTNFQYVYNLSTGESQYLNQRFTLPETGAYELTAFDQGIWTTTAYVMAEGAPIPEPVEPEPEPEPEPVPEVTWYETPDNGWIYSDAASTGSVTVTDSEGTVQTVYQYPVGTAFSIQSGQMTGGIPTVFLTGLYDLTTGTSLSLHDWTLPASGHYKLEAYDSWGGPNTYAYVTAEGTGTVVEPEPEEPAQTFTDVTPDAWYFSFVETVAEKGLFAGNGDGTFAPENNMTYAEFLAVLFQFSGDTLPAVTGGNWYDSYVEWAQPILPAGIADGFDPEAAITRQDMAALFGTFLSLYDYSAEPVNSGSPSFSDEGSIADYAKGGVALCYQLGIMNGNDDGTFAPGSNAIRAEVAVTMVQMARVMGR